MRLLTLNCHAWQEEDQLEKIDLLAATIYEKQYDVVALQEVSQKETSPLIEDAIRQDNYGIVLLEKIKQLGGSDYHLVWDKAHKAFDIYEEGLAIITKHPIKKVQSHYLTETTDFEFWKTRIALQVDIELNGVTSTFVSCHLGWWEDKEEPSKYQMDQLKAFVNMPQPVYLLGDFNSEAEKRDEGYDYMLNNGWFDTYQLANSRDRGITVGGNIAGWENNHDDKRIDFIFTNKKTSVISSNVIFNGDNKKVISDHFGVEVTTE